MSALDAFRTMSAADVMEAIAEDPSVLRMWQDEIGKLDAQFAEGSGMVEQLEGEVARLTAAKNGAYTERNLCVALIAKLVHDSSLEEDTDVWLGLHPAEDTDWEADWRNIVFIDGLGVGQMSWHIHDSELPLFAFLPRRPDLAWDGHTTEEKYERLRVAVRRR